LVVAETAVEGIAAVAKAAAAAAGDHCGSRSRQKRW
jgi:hypothetical protein